MSMPRQRRYSIASVSMMAPEHDRETWEEYTEMKQNGEKYKGDPLAIAAQKCKELKQEISQASKTNFVLEKDVRYLDSRIALLIQNRMALDEDTAAKIDEIEFGSNFSASSSSVYFPDDRKKQHYGNMFFLLQTEVKYIAQLVKLVNLGEMDALMQCVMFTLFGNQFERREEGLLLTMFQMVLAQQFEVATDFGSLLRANTPASRMMTAYTRRGPGQQYLKAVLSEPLHQVAIIESMDLEINPSRVFESLKHLNPELASADPETISENPQILAIIEPRVNKLIEIATHFLDIIIASIHEVPFGIRWICKQIECLTRAKYPDAPDGNIVNTIGGFFMLRYINPAIIMPNMGNGETTSGAHPKRILTMIAKLLQNLANKPTHNKEPYMARLSPFLENNQARFSKFLFDLCDVEDFSEQLEMDHYIALTRREICISISLNEMYQMHALLDNHKQNLATPDTDHLMIILNDLGMPPPSVPRSENKSLSLNLFSRWESSFEDKSNLLKLAQHSSKSETDLLFDEVSKEFVKILRVAPSLLRPQLKISDESTIPALVDFDHILRQSVEPGWSQRLVKKITEAMSTLQRLEGMLKLSKQELHQTMSNAVVRELSNLHEEFIRVAREFEGLNPVLKTISEHSSYLKSQLESYKAYLANVRTQSRNTNTSKIVIDNFERRPSGDMLSKWNHKSEGSNNSLVLGGGAANPPPSKDKEQKKTNKKNTITFTYQQLDKEGVIVESNVPENRRYNLYFVIECPMTGTFVISLHYKGREKPILEMEMKLDDLLEKQQDNVQFLDLEYVHFNVSKILQVLSKNFLKK